MKIGEKYIIGANNNYARISVGKLGDKFNKNDEVYILTSSEHLKLMQQLNKADKYINNSKFKDLQKQLKEKEKLITDLKKQINNIAIHNDELEKNLEQSITKTQFEDISKELESTKHDLKYWQNSYDNLVEKSDEICALNESLSSDIEKIRNDNNAINETNKLLNDNILALKKSFDETIKQYQLDFKNKESELKEIIKKQQSHIDELTKKHESLILLQNNIPQKQYYDEINTLKDEIRTLNEKNAKITDEITLEFEDKLFELKEKHTIDKAQLLVGYNNKINQLEMQYNNLAIEFNHLLKDANSLSRINIIFSNKHKDIVRDKKPIEIIEKENNEDIETIEKDKITLI